MNMYELFTSIYPYIALLILSAFLFVQMRIAKSTRKWKVAKGIIQINQIEEFGKVSFKGLEISYYYEIDGKEYTGYRIYATILRRSHLHRFHFIKKFIEKNYKHGQKVNVFYNPKNQNSCCLRRGGEQYVYQSFLTMTLILILVYFVWLN